MDVVVIVIPAVELWLIRPFARRTSDVMVAVISIFRVLRIVRGVMMLASIKWFRPLYLSAMSLKHAVGPLWAMGTYMAALMFTASVAICQYAGMNNSTNAEFSDVMRARFASVSATGLTMLECLVGGLEWGPTLVDPMLMTTGLILAGILLLAVLALGGLLWQNIVAGVFVYQVDKSFEATSRKAFADPERKRLSKELLKNFVQALHDRDKHDTGAVSFRDISAVLPHHMEELSDVGVGLPEAKKIFIELDATSTGHVSIDLFVSRIQDYMKYKPVEVLIYENQQYRLMNLVNKLAKRSKKQMEKVCKGLESIAITLDQIYANDSVAPQEIHAQLELQRQRVASSSLVSSADAAHELNKEMFSHELPTPPLTDRSQVPLGHLACSPNFIAELWKESLERQRTKLKAVISSAKSSQ